MKAPEKYRRVFGSISHLKDEIPWTTGLSNMIGFVAWEPQRILGISKKQYVNQIIEWATHPKMQGKNLQEIEKEVRKKLQGEMIKNEQLETYATQNTGICNAREAIRRVKFFSEDYLNNEFDIFINLCSDVYLDAFYQQFIDFNSGCSWSTHGNSGLFSYSAEIDAMYMDNLAYNHNSKVLVANELKLNGQKNNDQILKYCLMYEHLLAKGFIEAGAKYLLLFIGGRTLQHDKQTLVNQEISFCQCKPEKYQHLLRNELLKVVEHLEISSITWTSLIEFNNDYLNQNDVGQVEQKLLKGFNQSLQSKAFMQPSP